ncbi:MAG TPA: macro domain-containing protein [Methanomassiliicoccales archaeon]|nr:macro domain-containing protein [Methanomassiliicoccales archaeon]
MRREIEGVLIEVINGDITQQDTEAIVNAANSQLSMTSGVARAIKKRGGEGIEQEALSKAPVVVGDTVATGAGKLKARLVIHAVIMGEDLKTDESKVSSAVRGSLVRADVEGVTSISFPALGTGVGGLPFEVAARAMLESVIEYIRGPTDLTLVRFVLFDERIELIFRNALLEMGGDY